MPTSGCPVSCFFQTAEMDSWHHAQHALLDVSTRADAPSWSRSSALASHAGNHWDMPCTIGQSQLHELKLLAKLAGRQAAIFNFCVTKETAGALGDTRICMSVEEQQHDT